MGKNTSCIETKFMKVLGVTCIVINCILQSLVERVRIFEWHTTIHRFPGEKQTINKQFSLPAT